MLECDPVVKCVQTLVEQVKATDCESCYTVSVLDFCSYFDFLICFCFYLCSKIDLCWLDPEISAACFHRMILTSHNMYHLPHHLLHSCV